MTARELRIGFAPVLALRVTYLGELGWELHLPTEYAAHVYELLWAAGRDLGLANAGYRAIDSLRLEKRYLYWGSDITPDYTPYEAGLGFAVSLKKKSDFIGRAALEKAKAAGPARKLITLLVDADVQLYGGEAIRRNGKVLGVTSIAGWGHTIGKADRLRLRAGRGGGPRRLRDRGLHPPPRRDPHRRRRGRSAAQEDPFIGPRTSRPAS